MSQVYLLQNCFFVCVFGRGFGGAPGRERTQLLSPEGRAFARVFSADSCVFSAGQEGGQERGGSFINRHWRGVGGGCRPLLHEACALTFSRKGSVCHRRALITFPYLEPFLRAALRPVARGKHLTLRLLRR